MVFLLGGHGLLGSAFARVLSLAGTPYQILTRDNYAEFAGQSCRLFINANGNSRKPLAQRDPVADFDANVRSVRRTLIDFPSDGYLHLSSCDVYPDCSAPAVTPEDLTIDGARQSPYGFHKYLGELCVRHAHPNWLVFRLGGFVGPALKKNAIFDILNGGPLWLHPDSELQFLHTDTAASLMLSIAAQGVSREVFNLCGSGTIRLQEVIDFTGKQVAVQPGSPTVRYEVAIDKVSRHVRVPATRDTVLSFATGYTG
jgi:nucleoside-diphosphate-sugar epimerase